LIEGFAGVVGASARDVAARLAASLHGAERWTSDWAALASRAAGGTPPRAVAGRLSIPPGESGGAAERLRTARGSFALAEVDEERRTVLLAVDRLGAGGLFVHRDGAGRLWFASELNVLLRALPRRPDADEVAVVRRLADGLLPRGRTLYAGVERLRGGEYLLAAVGRVDRGVYWTPAYRPVDDAGAEETAAALLEAATDAVERAAAPAPADGLGVLLSGGLDSASVAALARRRGADLRGYTACFPDHAELDERRLALATAEHVGIESRLLSVRGSAAVASSLDYLDAWGLPSVSPNLFFQRPLLRLARDEGRTLLLDGQGGDELFGHAAFLLGDRFRRGALAEAVRLARRFPGAGLHPSRRVLADVVLRFGVRGAAPAGFHALRRRLSSGGPAWLAPPAARLAAETSERWAWKRGEGPLWFRAQVDDLTALRERMDVHDFLRRKESDAGVVGGHPFLDDSEFVETVLGLAPEPAFDPELDRALLRRAVRGLVPEEVLERRDKAWFDPLFVAALSGRDAEVVAHVLEAPDAEVSAYVRPEVVTGTLLQTPVHARGGRWASAVWRLFTTECWLRAERDPTFTTTLRERFALDEASYSPG
jgi:asparagine synthase (glutamine-hydrolysing)